ncbi:MAG: DUF58 domain-containing protein [Caldilineaceae bacterium]
MTKDLGLRRAFAEQLNRGLPETVRIRVRVWWPLIILPFAVLNQILAPHPVWLVLVIALSGLYGVGLFWVRTQAGKVTVERKRTGAVLVVGDTLVQDFELSNLSRLPVLWVEFVDESELPGHSPGRVAACGPYSSYRWASQVVCERRGVYRLGPHRLHFGDPFGIFAVTAVSPKTEIVLIYPRVVHLPEFELPHGNAGESRQRRRPLRGTLPSASVRDYRPGDSLRHVHWRSSARYSALMVKELEIEPSGDVWVVLDLCNRCNRSDATDGGQDDVLEYSIIVAASIAARLLSEGERRAVGLLAVSGRLEQAGQVALPSNGNGPVIGEAAQAWQASEMERQAVLVPPQPGQAQLWRILSALAPVEPTDVPLARLLRNSREVLGSRKTVIVVTAQTSVDLTEQGYGHHAAANPEEGTSPPETGLQGAQTSDATHGSSLPTSQETNWLAELAHLRASGLDSSVLLVTDGRAPVPGAEARTLVSLLAGEDIACQILDAAQPLRAALTFRRTRRVVRNTPSGGAVTFEVEEEVG